MYYEAPDAVVLIDPLVPPEDDERFRTALDRDVERLGRPVHVLVTVFWHARSAGELVGRYGGLLGEPPPEGVDAVPSGRAGEVLFWIPEHGALVAGDVIVGAEGGGLRLCPESWLPAGSGHAELRTALRPLLALPVERVLVSHGEPLLEGGHAALEQLLAT